MPQIDIKIQSIADLAALKHAIDEVGRGQAAIKKFREEGSGIAEVFRFGFGIGSGVEAARVGFELLKATIVDSARESFVLAGAIKDNSEALGVSREAYQVLGLAIEEAGGKPERMSRAVAELNRSLLDARQVSSAASGAFRVLGLNASELERLPVERRMEVIGRAIANAKDKTEAFGAAGEILGSKDLPTLLSALKALGIDGYDALAAKAEKAGKIMSDDTIERLDKAQKAIDALKRKVVIDAGESIAALGVLKQSAVKGFGDTLIGVLKASIFGDFTSLGATLAKNVPDAGAKTPPPPIDLAAVAAAEATKNKLLQIQQLKLDLTKADLANEDAQKDIHRTDQERRDLDVKYLNDKARILGEIAKITKSLPLGTTDPKARELELAKLGAEQQGAYTEATNKALPLADATKINRQAKVFSEGRNEDGGKRLDAGEGLTAGLQKSVISFGTVGEQIAGTIESTIGAAVHGVSDGIYGWITGTQTWGQAMLGLGRNILKGLIDQVVQLGIQQLLNGNIFKAVMLGTDALADTLRVGRVAKDNAAEAATLPLKTAGAAAAGISSYGVALAFGAIAIALIAAAAGGFEVGGYTTPGPSDKPAGLVHAGEWVAPKWMVQDSRYGGLIAGLEAARNGQPGFASGGFADVFASALSNRAAGLTSPASFNQIAAQPSVPADRSLADASIGTTVNVPLNVAAYDSKRSAIEKFRSLGSSEGRKFLWDIHQQNMEEFG